MFDFIHSSLEKSRLKGLKRSQMLVEQSDQGMIQVDGQPFLNFSSNDYHGQSQNPQVLQSWVDGLSLYGGGSGASPLITGYTKAHHELACYLAEKLDRQRVLLFSSGFAANQAVCHALGHSGVNLIADKFIHASLVDGAMNAKVHGATFKRFKHNDMRHLSQILNRCDGDSLVITEGVFSMDGDKGLIEPMIDIAQRHNAKIMIDDAHGFGVLGDTGLGTIEHNQLRQEQVDIVMGTFGKAIGTGGAFVAGSEALIEYLVNFSRHYIYSTMLPPAQAHATLSSIQLLRDDELKREKLNSNIQYFKQGAKSRGLNLLASSTPIQPILVGDPFKAVAASEKLKALGLWVNAIRSPTVPSGTDRLRVTLSSIHSHRDISALLDGLELALTC